MCWRPWAINMRQHLWNLPLNSHVGCDRTTGAPSQASNDTVTCITRPLLQCGGSPLVPPPPGSGVVLPGSQSWALFGHVIPDFFFLSSFEVERQEQSGGGGPARLPTLPAVDAASSSRFQHTTVCFSLGAAPSPQTWRGQLLRTWAPKSWW